MAQRRKHKQVATTSGGDMLFPGMNLAVIESDAKDVIPSASIAAQTWWGKLNEDEQKHGLELAEKLTKARMITGFGDLAQGAVLAEAHDLFEPHNLFGKFLRPFHFSIRTAYRYIRKYSNAKGNLHDNILKAAMVRGIPIAGESDEAPLGTYTRVVKRLPPPKKPDMEQANKWLDEVVQAKKEQKTPKGELIMPEPADPDTAAREVVALALNRFKKLPSHAKSAWKQRVLGMLAKAFNVETVEPIEIPEGFIRPRGAPRGPRKKEVGVA